MALVFCWGYSDDILYGFGAVPLGTVLFGTVFVYRIPLDIRWQAADAACFFLLMVLVVFWGGRINGVGGLSYGGTGCSTRSGIL